MLDLMKEKENKRLTRLNSRKRSMDDGEGSKPNSAKKTTNKQMDDSSRLGKSCNSTVQGALARRRAGFH